MRLARMLRAHKVKALSLAACGLLGVSALVATGVQAEETLRIENWRSSSSNIDKGSVYDYAPTVMKHGKVWKMWWCGGDPAGNVPGDDILYAVSSSPNGPFHAPGSSRPYKRVFEGKGGSGWDGQHTCDPSVIRNPSNGYYYMYYSGAVRDGVTRIGVARSKDGVSWTRLNYGKPIISPSYDVSRSNKYGAGQPSVTYAYGKYYLIFTDTTGRGAHSNGAGQFAWRSSSPTFQSGVEVFTRYGWRTKTSSNSRSFSVANAFSADWKYASKLGSFVLARNNEAGRTTLIFLKRTNLASHPYPALSVRNSWVEGPGLGSTPAGQVLPGTSCRKLAIELFNAAAIGSETRAPRALRRRAADLVGVPC
ncbi:MAG: hypothetical protein ACRDT6_20105 [Micromonosporaceae bacterium]